MQDILVDPWEVESPEDFLYYCCPECPEKFQGKIDFKNHALENHKRAQGLYFNGQNEARAAAEKLICIQQNSGSPSVGINALQEALSSQEASEKENEMDTTNQYDNEFPDEDMFEQIVPNAEEAEREKERPKVTLTDEQKERMMQNRELDKQRQLEKKLEKQVLMYICHILINRNRKA